MRPVWLGVRGARVGMSEFSTNDRLLTAIHHELVEGAKGLSLRAGFDVRVAHALADAVEATPDSLPDLMHLVVAVEEELGEAQGDAGASWSAFVDELTQRWKRSGHRAHQAAHQQMDSARRKLALNAKGPEIEAKDGDVKAGPLARFALNGPAKKPRRKLRGRRR